MKSLVMMRLLLALVAVAGVTAPAGAQKVHVRSLRPPEQPLPASVRRVAVQDIRGSMSTAFSGALVTTIGRNAALLRGMAWEPGTDPPIVDAVSGRAPADATIVGTADGESSDEWDNREETYWEDKVKRTRTVQYLTRRVRVTASLRVVDGGSGTVLATWAKETSRDETKRRGEDMPSKSAMFEDCAETLARGFVGVIHPHWVYEKVKLDKNPEVKDINEEAKDANFQGAWERYQIQRLSDPYDPALLYNIGLMHEAIQDHEEAGKFYDAAFKVNPRDKDYAAAADRSRASARALSRLAALGFQPVAKRFDATHVDQQKARETSSVATIRAREASLLRHPESDPSVQVKIPAGVEVEVLDSLTVGRDAYYQVKVSILAGEEQTGWIRADEISLPGAPAAEGRSKRRSRR